MKKIIGLLFIVLPFLAGERLYHLLTDGFYPFRITTDLPNRPEWNVDTPPPKEALSQNYSYLGSGAQCFVFESADHHYVIKFFKHHRWTADPIKRLFKDMSERESYREHTLMSGLYALNHLKDLSGVLYVHLNRGRHGLPVLTFTDKIGEEHHFDLNEYQFLIQKKGRTLKELLLECRDTGDYARAEWYTKEALNLFVRCHQRGVKNRDPHMTRNFGFVGHVPMVIDSGAFWAMEPDGDAFFYSEGLDKGTSQLRRWADKEFPQIALAIQEWLAHQQSHPLN